ncbi:L-threonylcarbamoyladenylate synthase [Blattabacterium cuenoti]|uniref:L-threonylcarbamoyladenylate synthase n=1 Tax=Blattabacterium cuenoti TaxID=1653831 RepID=UPI00163C3BEB|nr:L-threonylcarbamoyladenylate synthase [Blattabacterium cuenoti]
MFFFEEIERSTTLLKKGKCLLYPTDTVWGLGCDAFNLHAVEKIYKIKNRNLYKSMIILVENMDRLYELVEGIPDLVVKLINDNLHKRKKPITIVYENIRKTITNLFSINNKKSKTLAIRLTNDPFCVHLIRKLDRPIISTSANLSGEPTPQSFYEIHPSILNQVDYAVNFRRKEKSKYNGSSILKIVSNNKIKILRM